MKRRTRVVVGLARRLPRPDPPTPSYLRRARGELPRPLARLLLGPGARGVRLVDRVLPTEPYAVPVRVYRPRRSSGLLPLVINLHGGGFVFGNLTGADWSCGHLAAMAEAVVVSVDYRLAPEHPAPTPYDDVWAATTWLLANGERLGADPDRAAVVGDSAGGNLAALLTLALRDRQRADPYAPGLAAQALLYPATDLTMTNASVDELADAPVLPKSSIAWYGRQYLPQGLPHSIALDDPRVSPLHAADHADLPPALVVAAGRDPLRDDALRYASVLSACGVPVRTVLYPDALHGFMSIPLLEDAARLALDEVVAHVRGRLLHPKG